MNMMKYPILQAGARGAIGRGSGNNTEPSYTIAMRLSVEGPGHLWRAAAAHALTYAGCEEEDLEAVLGPMEDPSIDDCIVMLLGPRAIAGCRFDAFTMVQADAELDTMRVARPAVRSPRMGGPLNLRRDIVTEGQGGITPETGLPAGL